MIDEITLDRLVEELFINSPEKIRCPYIRRDENGPYCAKNLKEGSKIVEERRLVCDVYSLQLWCLDKDRCHNCIFFNGEPFRPII